PDLLFGWSQKQVDFLRFREHDEALSYLESLILDSNAYEAKSEPVCLMDQQLLATLTEHEIEELKKHLIHRTYLPSETIIRKGSGAVHIFFIEWGRGFIPGGIDGPGGVTLALTRFGKWFGQVAPLEKEGRAAALKAQKEVSVFVMLYEILDSVESLAAI